MTELFAKEIQDNPYLMLKDLITLYMVRYSKTKNQAMSHIRKDLSLIKLAQDSWR